MGVELLVPVSVGELIDKITILEIKKEHIEDRDRLKNVNYELEKLKAVLAGMKFADDDVIKDLATRLKMINLQIWNIEDQIRELDRLGAFDELFISVARSVYRSNDVRASLKKEINRFTGSAVVEEKGYKNY